MIKLITRKNDINSAFRGEINIKNKLFKIKFFSPYTDKETGERAEKEFYIEKDFSDEENTLFILVSNGNDLKLIEAFKHTYACREQLDFLREMFNTTFLLIFKVGKKTSNEDLNLLIESKSIRKENLEIISDLNIQEEVLEYENGLFPIDKRRDIFPAYSLMINGIEYKANDEGEFLIEADTNIVYNSEYIDLTIKKYNHYFTEEMIQHDDNEKIYIESTCGILNATMLKLENGIGTVRLYPFGYEGIFTIKIGWRWYRVRNQYDLVLKKV